METADTLAPSRRGPRRLEVDGHGAITLRPLDLDDLAAMQGLLGRSPGDRGDASTETIIRSLDWRPASASSLTLGVIDEASNRLIGLAGLASLPSDRRGDGSARFGVLVDPACRRQGIARSLLAALIEAAERAGYRSLRCQTREATPAIRALARAAGLSIHQLDGDEPVVLERHLGDQPPARPASGLRQGDDLRRDDPRRPGSRRDRVLPG